MKNFYKALWFGAAFFASTQISFAQVAEEEIIVTATKASQGGAQDIKHFRGEADRGQIPSPKGMTSEGLLSEHDLYLRSSETCRQTLCLNAAAKTASIIDGNYFVGLSFDTNISDEWKRDPLNLIAVIDRSGSMNGASITNVKRSLLKISDNLHEGDQISFVLYGSDVVTHMEPLAITKDAKRLIKEKIGTIVIEGSTNMDAGLARGYEIAYETKPNFQGNTRVMIFTDERPNTGRVDSEGFMARAKAASLEGIGLTTIGYGVDYGGELGAKISSVRGGNLFYVAGKDDVDQLFKEEFDFMVSELAHDLSVTIKPSAGLKIENVYGVPEYMMTRLPTGAVEMSVPTVFFSSKGGGLFASLKGESRHNMQPLFDVNMQYKEGARRQFETVKGFVTADPEPNLGKAEALSAQYTAMKLATETYYDRGSDYSYQAEQAFDIFNVFARKFKQHEIEGLETEYELVAALNESLALQADRLDALENPPNYARLRGLWQVTHAKNMQDVRRGDRMKFSANEMELFRKSVSLEEPHEREHYQVNDKQIYLSESDLTFKYFINKKGNLNLRHRDMMTSIRLKPVAQTGSVIDALN